MWAGVSHHEKRYWVFIEGMCVWLLYREAFEHVCAAGGSHIHPQNAPTRWLQWHLQAWWDNWHGLESQREEYGCAPVWVCVNSWKASFEVYVYFVLCNVYFFCITVLVFLKVYIEYYCTGLKLWFLHREFSPPVLFSNQLSRAPITISMVREHLCQLTGSKQSSAIKMPPNLVSIWNCCVQGRIKTSLGSGAMTYCRPLLLPLLLPISI